MSWENYSEWHIDHKIPLKYNKTSLEEVVQFTTQIHSLCGQVKICQRAVDIFLAKPASNKKRQTISKNLIQAFL